MSAFWSDWRSVLGLHLPKSYWVKPPRCLQVVSGIRASLAQLTWPLTINPAPGDLNGWLRVRTAACQNCHSLMECLWRGIPHLNIQPPEIGTRTHKTLVQWCPGDSCEGFSSVLYTTLGFPGGSDGNGSACNAGDPGSIPGLGRSLGGGHGCPLQYSCLANPMDRGAWWAKVHGVAKCQTRLSD